MVTVALSDATSYMRLPPGETTLAKATKITFTDVAEGDRVLATGKVADDHKSVPCASPGCDDQSDIAKKAGPGARRMAAPRNSRRDQRDQIRTKEITITTRTLAGSQPVIIRSRKIEMRRYALIRIKFSDAKVSSFEDLKVGDQLRALGEKSADGTHFTAERVVTGVFQNCRGVVTAIDTATGEVKINELDKKKP